RSYVDWSSDVCSSDLVVYPVARGVGIAGTFVVSSLMLRDVIAPQGIWGVLVICVGVFLLGAKRLEVGDIKALGYAAAIGVVLAEIGRASCREGVWWWG